MTDVISITPGKKQITKRNICYCRVSTSSQKEDLERQVEYFRCNYPNHEIIKDIGSGLNFKRKGFKNILDSAFKGDIGEIVITNEDRLCIFGFELVLRIIESTNGKILVLDKEKISQEKELDDEILSIITIFSSRLTSNEIKNKIQEATSISESSSGNETGNEQTQ